MNKLLSSATAFAAQQGSGYVPDVLIDQAIKLIVAIGSALLTDVLYRWWKKKKE